MAWVRGQLVSLDKHSIVHATEHAAATGLTSQDRPGIGKIPSSILLLVAKLMIILAAIGFLSTRRSEMMNMPWRAIALSAVAATAATHSWSQSSVKIYGALDV